MDVSKKLDRDNFIRRAGRLRRINMRGWMLIFSLAAYGLIWQIPAKSEPWLAMLPLLLFAPAVFMMRKVFSSRDFCCPCCHDVFTEETAPLVIATGNCTSCCTEILSEHSEDSAKEPLFIRDDFTVFHHVNRRNGKLWAIIIILGAAFLGFVWLLDRGDQYMGEYPWIKDFYLLVFNSFRYWPTLMFGMAALGYMLYRMRWRKPRAFEQCPHCGGILDGYLPEVAIASGRCGLCGDIILTDSGRPDAEGVYLLPRYNRQPQEFYWMVQAILAALIFLSVAALDEHPLLKWILAAVLAIELALLWRNRNALRRQKRCAHHQPSLVVKTTGHCGICGTDLNSDDDLFRVIGRKMVLRISDPGVYREAVWLLFAVLFTGAFFLPLVIGRIPANTADWIGAAMAVTFFQIINLSILWIFVHRNRLKYNGCLLSGDSLELTGPDGYKVLRADIREVKCTEAAVGKIKNDSCWAWEFKAGNSKHQISARTFADLVTADEALRNFFSYEKEVKSKK